MLRRIISVAPDSPTALRLTFDDGSDALIDFAEEVAAGGVFAPLADHRFFNQVSIGPSGRSLCWPNEIDFCADALWLRANADAHSASAPG